MIDTTIIVPVLGRAHHIEPLVNSLHESTDEAELYFVCTTGDDEPIAAIESLGQRYAVISHKTVGDYAYKINKGYYDTKTPYLFLGATDLKFHKGWLTNAKAKLSDQVHVVGTNDMGNSRVLLGNHSTHSLVTRYYCDTMGTVDEVGKVLHEGYFHEFVDNEFVETAIYRDAWAMAMDSLVEHLHPAWDKGEWDQSYLDVDKRIGPSKIIFNKRRSLWTQL